MYLQASLTTLSPISRDSMPTSSIAKSEGWEVSGTGNYMPSILVEVGEKGGIEGESDTVRGGPSHNTHILLHYPIPRMA